MEFARKIAIAVILAAACAAPAFAQLAQDPPAEATGEAAAAAKAWLTGRWSMSMTPEGIADAEPQTVKLDFAADGRLTITFSDESEPEGGAWRVTAADAASASVLLDEDELDADPDDDIYLDVTYQGADAGKGVLRSDTETDRVAIALTREGSAPLAVAPPQTPPAETPKATPIALLAEPPASISGAIDSVKAAGAPADARLAWAAVDLNGDCTDEALVKITHMYWCSGGMESCRLFILTRTPSGSWDSLGYPYAKGVALLESSTNGYRDLEFDGAVYVKSEYGGYGPKEP
jgi:hypothetical protein